MKFLKRLFKRKQKNVHVPDDKIKEWMLDPNYSIYNLGYKEALKTFKVIRYPNNQRYLH